MALTNAFPGPTGVVDSTQLRKDLAGLIFRDATGLPRAGVFPRHMNALVTSRATLGVDVAAFDAALVRGNGPLFIQNDGTVTVPVGAAPASNSRYDVVYVKQNESVAPYADANDSPVFGFVSGAAAASPSLSAAVALVPSGALPLAAVLIPSTATTTQSSGVVITQLFTYTATAGGTLVVRNQTERDAATWPDGAQVWRLDIRALEIRDTGAWQTFDTVWQTYTPTLSGPTTVGVGTGGSLTGEYMRAGKVVHVRIAVAFGSSLSITPGSVRLSLPIAGVARTNGQRIQGQYFYTPIGTINALLYIASGGTQTPVVVVPISATSNAHADLNMGSSAGNGVPSSPGAFGVSDNSNLLFEGSYAIA